MATTVFSLFNNNSKQDNISKKGEDAVADAILSLMNMFEANDKLSGISPEDILADSRTGVYSAREEFSENAYYTAPEMILSGNGSNSDCQLFTLGSLIYFVIYGKNYYENNNTSITALPDAAQRKESLLEYEAVPKLNEALKALSAFSPAGRKRVEGMKLLVEYLTSKESLALLNISDNGTETEMTMKIPVNGYTVKKGTIIKAKGGECYMVLSELAIPFRPGKQKYVISVKSCDPPTAAQADSGINGKLVLKCIDEGDKTTSIFDLDGTEKIGLVDITREKPKKYQIGIERGGSSPIYRYVFTVPALPNADCALKFFFTPPTNVYIVIIDKKTNEPMKPVSSNAQSFKL